MFYYLYEIKNNLNGKVYVGVHRTKNMDDGYMGSGKVIKSAIEKYGIDNFSKTILQQFSTAKEMFDAEKRLVNNDFLLREDVYNLRRGGSGGFDYINSSGILKFKGKKHSEHSKKLMGHMDNKYWLGKKHTDETKRKIGLKSKITNTGKIKSEETKNRIRKAALNQIQEVVHCPYCEKVGNKNIMIRWHFDNCKEARLV